MEVIVPSVFRPRRKFAAYLKPIRSPLSTVNGDESSPGSPIGQLYTRNGALYPGALPPPTTRESSLRTFQAARSHESLLGYGGGATHAIDLGSGEVSLKVLHPSVLGAPNCVQVQTKGGATKYYSCRTPAERDRWVHSIRRTMNPGGESGRRRENWLQLWVLEAKGVASKRRFFVELCFDQLLYARTSAKAKTDICFWGEAFEFAHLPSLETVCLNLYREPERKKKKDRATLVGFVRIPVSQLSARHPVEKWYVVQGTEGTSAKAAKGSTGAVAIRVKGKWSSVEVLPPGAYVRFLNILSSSYLPLALALEPALSVKAKEDFATSLVRVLQNQGQAARFLADLVMAEVDALDNEHLMFRGNSLATKSMEAYMKLVGDAYLQDTLGEFVRAVLDSNDDCEVDPLKLGSGSLSNLERHQKLLTFYVEMAWGKLVNSFGSLPLELRAVFAELRRRLEAAGRGELADNVISSSLFLRFLCPAILSPSLFGLVAEYPSGRGARNLTLIAKTVQTLANFSKFGGKEHYMEFMNAFVDKEWSHMRTYLRRISSSTEMMMEQSAGPWCGSIDTGKELALLHTYLQESWISLAPRAQAEFADLRDQLDVITDALEDPSHPLNYAGAGPPPSIPAPDLSPLSDYENNNHKRLGPSPSGRQTIAHSLDTADEYVSADVLADNLQLRNIGYSVQERRHQRPRKHNPVVASVSAKEAVLGRADGLAYADEPTHMRHAPLTPSSSAGPHPNSDGHNSGRKGSQLSIVGPSSGYNSLNHSSHSSSSASSSPVDRPVPQPRQHPPLSIANPLYSLTTVPLRAGRPTAQSLPDIQAAALSISLSECQHRGSPHPVSGHAGSQSTDTSLEEESGVLSGDCSLSQPAFSAALSSSESEQTSGVGTWREQGTAPRTNPRIAAVRSPRLGTSGAQSLIRRTKTDAGLAILNPAFDDRPRPKSTLVSDQGNGGGGMGKRDGKQAIIDEQQRTIDSLVSENQRLAACLSLLKDRLTDPNDTAALSGLAHNLAQANLL